MGGIPCIRGLRIPVAAIIGMIAEGACEVEILADYPDLSAEDVREALRFAAEAVSERQLPLIEPKENGGIPCIRRKAMRRPGNRARQ
jgi:uncharacterized protein (DUF433 family)